MEEIENLDDLLREREGFLRQLFLCQLRKNKPFVDAFCRRYDVRLLKITRSMETGTLEQAYTFADDADKPSCYRIEGIMASL